jgi:hypothetical protein
LVAIASSVAATRPARAQSADAGATLDVAAAPPEVTPEREADAPSEASQVPSADRSGTGAHASDNDWNEGGGGGAGVTEADAHFGAPKFTVNGFLRLQAGVFLPLISDGFEAHRNQAYIGRLDGQKLEYLRDQPCDPVLQPYRPCYPVDHGQKPGSLSAGRATLQFEADWQAADGIGVHAILRGVRSLALEGDDYAQIPQVVEDFDGQQRRAYARSWVHDRYYTELDLRELYLDLAPVDWLAMRLGRQQVAWGETSSFRLLDIINPVDNTWHFGALESFEDTRIPLWMALFTLDVVSVDASLELVWVPLLDDPADTVSVPLTFAGAWGVPYSNAPTSFFAPHQEFRYPGGELSDGRVGARWKGIIGSKASYSLVYHYTHQTSSPIPTYYINGGTNAQGVQLLDRYVLDYPRNHVAGGTLEYAFDSPIGTVLRLEASFVPNQVLASRTDASFTQDASDPNRYNYHPQRKAVINYALSLQRSTMVRFLNPTQSFLLFAQFSDSFVPGLDIDGTDYQLVQVPLYNEWAAQKHSLALVGMAQTTYLYGAITPRITGAWLPNLYAGDSGFYSLDVEFRLATNYGLNLRATDFFGADPYRELGLYRDRDEVHATLTIQY